MKQGKIAAFLMFVFVIISINVSAQQLYQTISDLKVRSGPGTKYKTLFKITKGSTVNVLEKDKGSWYKIEHNGKTGYVSSEFVMPVVETSEITEAPKIEDKTIETSPTLLYIIGIIAIVGVVYIVSSRTKKKRTNTLETLHRANKEMENITAGKADLIKNILENIKIEVTHSNSTPSVSDESIIDVTGNAYNLRDHQKLLRYKEGVPIWTHQYVYSFAEINAATPEQIKFYNYFKYHFQKGDYIDLEGNNNYAFILLFDLINDYEIHKNLLQVKRHLDELEHYYPKTKPYAAPSLTKKLAEIGDIDAIGTLGSQQISSFSHQQSDVHTNTSFDGNYWGLGTKYKSKLNLKDEEVTLVNRLWYPSNVFCSIEYCRIEVLKVFLLTINALKAKFVLEHTTLEKELMSVVDVILRTHFRYKLNSFNYKNSIESTETEIYSNIFKYCENAVRDHYGHKRKVNTDTYFTTPAATTELETKIIGPVIAILPALIPKVVPPDEATQIELNAQNTSRWKTKFDELTTKYNGNTGQFFESILSLGKLNKKNLSIENIFFEASKFISKYDKEIALKLYVHYLYYDLQSAAFDNKQLTKTIQKSLFKTNEQLHDFEIVVSDLIKEKDLEKALKAVSTIYTVKRKKIQLNNESIKEVQQQDSGTVALLTDYLNDEYEDENITIKTREINTEEVRIEITQNNDEMQSSTYAQDIAFSQIHTTVLEMFSKNNFSVSQSELETFAKSKGVFRNQLIESINEICYENLDDILIEEEDDYYTINPNYYQTLLVK